MATDQVLRLFITNYCDQVCLHCDNSRLYSSDESYMPLDKIKARVEAFLALSKDKKFIEVLITGGEPATHPQVLEVLTYLQERKIIKVIFVTNGLRFLTDPDFYHQFLKLKIPAIIFSLEASGEDYAALRSAPHHDKLVSLIRKMKLSASFMEVSINVTLHKRNKDTLLGLLKDILTKHSFLSYIRILVLNKIPNAKEDICLTVEEELLVLKSIENDSSINFSKIRFINSDLGFKELNERK